MISWHENPWQSLSSDEFVLREDLPFVEEFNRTARKPARIATHLVPEPFFGPRDAPVVVLLLNPGVGKHDKQ